MKRTYDGEMAYTAEEAINRNDTPVEINCCGKFRNIRKSLTAEIYNEKTGQWYDTNIVEYRDVCPICGKLMLVRAVCGSTWLACCSEDCYNNYFEKRNEKENAPK